MRINQYLVVMALLMLVSASFAAVLWVREIVSSHEYTCPDYAKYCYFRGNRVLRPGQSADVQLIAYYKVTTTTTTTASTTTTSTTISVGGVGLGCVTEIPCVPPFDEPGIPCTAEIPC